MREFEYLDNRTHYWLPFLIATIGVLVSIVLLFTSLGSNDIFSWNRFALEIQEMGLFQLYKSDRLFNHPPLMGILAWQSLELSSLLGLPFHIVFKALMVISHIGTAFILKIIWTEKVGHHKSMWVFAAFIWALSSLLVAAYHGNTDSMVVLFCLLSLYFADRKNYGLSGLMFAAAINIKIIPLLLLFPMIAGIRQKVGIWQFCLGVSIGIIPFLITWVGVGPSFVYNLFGYGSNIELWGFQLLLSALDPFMEFEVTRIVYVTVGKILIVTLILLLSLFGYNRRWDTVRIVICAFILFLVFAPGFGVQYIVYLTPFLFVVNPRLGFFYASISGLFIGSVYFSYLTFAYPWQSLHTGIFLKYSVFVGFLLWYSLIYFLRNFLLDENAYVTPFHKIQSADCFSSFQEGNEFSPRSTRQK